jgi:hypothetical protein
MTHHAYYIEGDLALFEEYAKAIPHFLAQKHERFGIDESRELAARASLKVIDDTALFLIGVSSLTSEAQQALLKLFEEPQPGVVFVFVLPHGTLLPTLRSRMLEYPVTKDSPLYLYKGESFVEAAVKFLKSNQKARSAQITALLKDEEEVKERVRTLLAGLEAELAKHLSNPKARAGLEDIAKVRSYVGDRSPALKMLLEHLALSLPTF